MATKNRLALIDNYAPEVDGIDVVTGKNGVNATILGQIDDVVVRYKIHFDSYQVQCRFTVEAYCRPLLEWRELWTLDPEGYGHERLAYRDINEQVFDTQEIVNDLTVQAARVLGWSA